jgi:hypothetical protein
VDLWVFQWRYFLPSGDNMSTTFALIELDIRLVEMVEVVEIFFV